MPDSEKLTQLMLAGGRRIFVAQHPIDFRTKDGVNCVYVLELPMTAPGAAGGRIGGIGERKIQKVHCFRFEKGDWMKVCETEESEKLERFELPYHAASLGVTMPDGSEKIVTGLIDEELVQGYTAIV